RDAKCLLRLWAFLHWASRRLTARSRSLHALDVLPPHFFLVESVVVEKIPGIDARTVAVGEGEQDRVGADRLDVCDLDVPLADLQDLLARPMAAHLRRR